MYFYGPMSLKMWAVKIWQWPGVNVGDTGRLTSDYVELGRDNMTEIVIQLATV